MGFIIMVLVIPTLALSIQYSSGIGYFTEGMFYLSGNVGLVVAVVCPVIYYLFLIKLDEEDIDEEP